MIIGIAGNKRHGKDTIGNYLIEKYGFEKISFAQPIKDIIKMLFNFSDEQLNGDLKEVIDENWNFSPRFIMQFIGSSFRNNIQDDIWIKILENKIKNDKKYVITDLRYVNENEFINRNNGIKIRVKRNILSNDTHESEQYVNMLDVDYEIDNNGTLEELYEKVDKILLEKNF